jgi:hypothetical protein
MSLQGAVLTRSRSLDFRTVQRAAPLEPGEHGWRRFIYFLFVYMTFEGLLRRSLPAFNLQILLLKDVALFFFYGYFGLCVYPNLPAWRKRDGWLTVLGIFFVLVNLIELSSIRPDMVLSMIIALKANFWYVPIFFIGRRYFTTYRQIRKFWSGMAWILAPVVCVGIWQVFFGQFTSYAAPTGPVDAQTWAAAGAGSLRNNTDGTMIATVASTFFGGRFAEFAAIWVLFSVALCISGENKRSFLRMPYLYIALACASVSLFISANRTAVGMSAVCVALLFLSGGRRSFRVLARIGTVVLLTGMLVSFYETTRTSDVLESQFHSFTSFFSGLLDAPGLDVRGSRYSVIGTDIVRGIQLAVEEVGPFGGGLGLMTQGAIYVDPNAHGVLDVLRRGDGQTDSQWVRLTAEIGIVGLVLYLALVFRLLWVSTRQALRARRKSWVDGLTAALAPVLLLLYLGFAHKHAGFAIDPMFQCYVYFTLGAVLGGAARDIAA